VAQRSVAAVKRLLFFFWLPTPWNKDRRDEILKGPVTPFCSLTILVANFLTDVAGGHFIRITSEGASARKTCNSHLRRRSIADDISAPERKYKHPAGTISKLSSEFCLTSKSLVCAFHPDIEAQHNEHNLRPSQSSTFNQSV
jgi:hypothetical protein